MAAQQSQLQKQTQYIPPKCDYATFLDDAHFKEKLKEWGLPIAKKEFLYKDRGFQTVVSIKGYESYGITGEYDTLVIEFDDGKLSLIHPAYLKEMQSASFGKESLVPLEEKSSGKAETLEGEPLGTAPAETQSLTKANPAAPKAVKPKETKPKKEKAPKLELPADKVHFTATVKQFALTYNPFNEENDEVVVLENVQIVQDEPLELGLSWCSHSKTLKKFELAPGDQLEFDGKVAAKKLAKGKDASEEFIVDEPVLYKINNPSKIAKK
ncbi:hypothetical protein M3234_05420 [Neobacillus niacini]|nr:hypothetical protein [Neobacillus niacini]